MTLQEDTVITGFTATYGNGTHHIFLSQTLAPEPNGFSDCAVLFKTTWVPLFLAGKGTTPVVFPAGVGMKLLKGTQVLLQLHLLNATSAPITDATKVEMTTTDPTKPFVPAGIFGIDDRNIDIPPNATNYQVQMSCMPDKQMDVFAVFGHMHQIGTHITVMRNGTDTVLDSDWSFDVQPTTQTSLTLTPTDTLSLQCTYANPSGSPVVYGESSTNEMCAFVLYYTSFSSLDGCVQQ
jgi:hypothetical protein